MPRLDTLRIECRSGNSYEFRAYILGHAFKRIPAVYIVMERRIEPGKAPVYLPVYAGETNDLSSSLSSHPKEECFTAHYANTVAALREPDAGARGRLLSELLSALSPPCNRPTRS